MLEPGGTIDDRGSFDVANESTFDVEGGSVTSGVPTTGQFLGQGAATIKFGRHLPATSRGVIDVATSVNLQGVIPKQWAIDNTGGSIAATKSGNAGTFVWEDIDNSTFSDPTTFVNSGTFTDDATGWSQDIEVSRFVNTGTVIQRAGLGLLRRHRDSGACLRGLGRLNVAPKQSFSAAGVFDLAAGGTIDNRGVSSSTGRPSTSKGLGPGPAALGPLPPGRPARRREVRSPGTGGVEGAIDIGIPVTLYGVVPKHWTLDVVGGPGPTLTASHSGNNGTIIWGANAPLSATGTFVNSGDIDVTDGSLEMTAPDFVDAPGSHIAVIGDSGISDSGNMANHGSIGLGPGNRVSVSGDYSQSATGDLTVAVAGSFSTGTLSVGGHASLGGALTVEKIAGLKVQSGDMAQLLTAHTISGRFRPVRGLGRPGPDLAIVYAPGA